MSVAIWGFDRALRLAQMFRRGFKRAFISPIDSEYMRVDIPGVGAQGHVYPHFPTISSWKFWESHPFSVAGSSCNDSKKPRYSSDLEQDSRMASGSGLPRRRQMTATMSRKTGVTLFIKQKGLIAKLCPLGTSQDGIPVMVEGSCSEEVTFLQETHLRPTPDYRIMVCFAGGVGTTGALAFLDKFGGLTSYGAKRLFWSVRSMPLLYAVEGMLGEYTGAQGSERQWGDFDVSVSVGRFSVRNVLQEHQEQVSGGTTMVVCGPANMADQVRIVVSTIAKSQKRSKVPMKLGSGGLWLVIKNSFCSLVSLRDCCSRFLPPVTRIRHFALWYCWVPFLFPFFDLLPI